MLEAKRERTRERKRDREGRRESGVGEKEKYAGAYYLGLDGYKRPAAEQLRSEGVQRSRK